MRTRYSTRALPARRYLPGRGPHPDRDPTRAAATPAGGSGPLEADRWWRCDDYLHGVDLFNAGFWWEAHEAFEGPWRLAGRSSATCARLQGLIQIAAGLLKLELGARRTARRLAARGCARLRATPRRLLGFDAEALCGAVEAHLDGLRGLPPSIALALPAGVVASAPVEPAYRIAFVRVFVTDWEQALRFYTGTLGMGLALRNDELGWAELDTGEARLALERMAADDAEGVGYVGRVIAVSLRVPDIDATYAALVERGVEFLGPPQRQPWGGALVHLKDPEGNVLTLLGSAT